LASALKSSGKSSPAGSEITRTVAQGMPCLMQDQEIASDSISTASQPVSSRKIFFSAAVVAMRSAQKNSAGFAAAVRSLERRFSSVV
jgi:predicted transcriptional regulator